MREKRRRDVGRGERRTKGSYNHHLYVLHSGQLRIARERERDRGLAYTIREQLTPRGVEINCSIDHK